jgi:hypothetical protein
MGSSGARFFATRVRVVSRMGSHKFQLRPTGPVLLTASGLV